MVLAVSPIVREIPPLTMTYAPPTSAVETDRALLDRMARGDERALGQLYDRYSARLYAVAYRLAGERADAEEIVLEALSQAWREAARFQSDKGSVAADPDVVPGFGAPEAGSESRVAHAERARRVADALASRSPPQRQAIELAYYEGLSHSEIAERLNEPLGTIKTRVRLAMQKLREALRPHYFEATT